MDEKKAIDVTSMEAFWLWVMRRNQAEKKERIERKLEIGRLQIRYLRRRKSELWGRFGGGWNWEFGFQAGGRTIIFNLLIASLSFHIKRKEEKGE